MSQDMQAVTIHQFGGAEVLKLESVARPEPGPDEVLIRVQAAGVNPIDYMTRNGVGVNRGWQEDQLPVVLGWDVSGIVEASNSEAFKPGDEVFTMPRFPAMAGAYAEYAAVPAAELAAKPASIDHPAAAGVPLVALTAWQALFDNGNLASGQTVLIHAAAGGVGHVAVQLAKWRGATVIGTASGRNQAFVLGLGADQFVDYTACEFDEVVKDVDAVFHTIPAELREKSWRTLNADGILLSITGPVPEEEIQAEGKRGTFVGVRPNGAQLGEIAGLIDDGTLRVEIDTVYPLADAAKAHQQVEARHARGKVVLRVAG
ncbi:MAG: NADP-dependent oxidoreductase [Rhodospirillales bacterium]|mgnify:CR=1 FL=1|jgi:NADPH:quinone reductase-like Zn-dependent oxidoreductase|nr:NADPH:quinone reductase [Rhodospirillaceae bacterium]MAF49627.1 NADPH:quinone reductase [Rhodospirillaceae bacterium]MDP6428923.1 NADP-dependent oxidoreductase [Rhodospirillales bacterium]MDP6644950.1 NADP-dependent oxidoreductase [Rhodospirillales bacterium]MDP6840514.1 NADP-dependent oxidoreductase [Rhodospirillales bacterium]